MHNINDQEHIPSSTPPLPPFPHPAISIFPLSFSLQAFSSPADDPSLSPSERSLLASPSSSSQPEDSAGGGVHMEGAPLQLAGIPWGLLLSKAPVWAIIISHFCHNWGVFILLTWMPTYYHDVSHGLRERRGVGVGLGGWRGGGWIGAAEWGGDRARDGGMGRRMVQVSRIPNQCGR